MNMHRYAPLLFAFTLSVAGCRMGVPVHVWQPPQIESTVGKRVVVSSVVGPEATASGIQERLIDGAPQDSGRQTTLVAANELESKSQVRLTAGSDAETSDVVLASVARGEGYDYVLRGEVVEDRGSRKKDSHDRLTVSWRLFDLSGQRSAGGAPVVIDTETAIDRYPDLAMLTDKQQVLQAALVRETYRLITPAIERDRVQLAIPYLLPGSKEVRRGNIAAISGHWAEAEQIWQAVADQHPTQVAAVHNLALAAAAAQDFSRAKRLARSAIRRQPTRLHKQTLIWIELNQRAYHQAFNLPDPPEGWFMTK